MEGKPARKPKRSMYETAYEDEERNHTHAHSHSSLLSVCSGICGVLSVLVGLFVVLFFSRCESQRAQEREGVASVIQEKYHRHLPFLDVDSHFALYSLRVHS